tara:strand:- start:382 stop:750 length:369 start_codon:yes stop_codon:yes gene_type:complete
MKSNIEKVYSKLPKTELAKVELAKVELGIVDDFTKIFEKANNGDVQIGKTLISALSKAENSYKGQISDYENAIKLGDKAEKAAKDLGVELPSPMKNKILSSKEAIKEAKSIISKINQLYGLF